MQEMGRRKEKVDYCCGKTTRRGHWVYDVETNGDGSYQVNAHCSECGWRWFSEDGVGNYHAVFRAFIYGNNKTNAELFALYQADQRNHYHYCPVCGAELIPMDTRSRQCLQDNMAEDLSVLCHLNIAMREGETEKDALDRLTGLMDGQLCGLADHEVSYHIHGKEVC